MALQSRQVLQNENLPTGIGKNAEMMKADLLKPSKTTLQDRKALRDLSNTSNPLLPAKSKGSALRDISNTGKTSVPTQSKRVTLNKSAIKAPELKVAAKCSFLPEDEIRKCDEWAKEGIELVHFTGNDLQKFKENERKECVKRKAERVVSSLREWSNATYNLFPVMETLEIINIVKMEMVPEVFPLVRKPLQISVMLSGDDTDDLLEVEADQFPFLDCALDLKLKEESSF